MNLKQNTLALATVLVLVPFVAPLTGQEESSEAPAAWQVRTDRGGHGVAGDLSFVDMPPGWHITTGPAGILYDPANTAGGDYRIEMEVFLFDPGQRREGYGMIFGGTGLDGDGQAYSYFLIRQDGAFLVKARDGDGTTTVEGWTPHDAIVTWDEREDGAEIAKNVLAVEVGSATVSFFVNGQSVATVPKADLHTDGIFGIRANHGLNLHVAKLEKVG